MAGGNRKKQRQGSRQAEIQQATTLENKQSNSREVEPPINFYLSSLEEQIQCQLIDEEARLTQTNTQGRVLLDIHEDSLATFLDELQEHKDVKYQTSNTKDLQTELEQMKAENETLQNHLEAKNDELRAYKRLIAVAKTNVELELESYLEIERAQTQKLRHELSKMEETLLKQKEEQRVEATRFAAALKNTQDLLETERHRFQQEKESILQKTENSTACCLAQLNEQTDKNRKLMAEVEAMKQDKSSLVAELEKSKASHLSQLKIQAVEHEETRASQKSQIDELKQDKDIIAAALKEVQQQLKMRHLQWQEDRSSLLAQMELSQADHLAHIKMQADENKNSMAALKKKLEDQLESSRLQWQQEKTFQLEENNKTRASYLFQLEEKKQDNTTIVAALKEAEKQLTIGHLQWQEDKSFLQAQVVTTQATHRAQLEVQAEENKNLVAALKQAEQQLVSNHIQWKEEKSSLLHTTEDLEQTLQDKEQEWQQNESLMRSQLEDLESQIKKKKEKWYRKLF
ncbi:centromere protein F-like [Centropristis striata]|uniref:centromere protein F-like n=1 Tax=Centropristis striata TaxID=184440 RepID=UPI0027E135CE|nr:centromere protein F-like [Centropristis striata]